MAHTDVPGGRGAARASRQLDILVADDDDGAAEALAVVLRKAGHSVRLARHGGEAFALASASVPDLVVSDIMMPEMDGFMLCRRIREDRRLAGVPVILYSSVFCFDDDRELAMSLGASRFLVKPIGPSALLEAVRAETDRTAGRRAGAGPASSAMDERQYRALLEKLHLKIKELEAARLQLAASEARYQGVTAALSDYVYTVHVENGRAVRTEHGESCLKVTGYSRRELEEDPHLWLRMVAEEDRPAVTEHARAVLSGKSPGPLEHRITRKDGAVRWVSNTPVLHRGPSGGLLAYTGVLRDITARKEAEKRQALTDAALLQSQKMEVAGRLASGIAHDFNNILTAITGYAGLAVPLLPEDSPVRGNLEEISRSAERAAQLTRQLLAFSRRQVLGFRTLDLNAVMTDMRDMLERLIGEDITLAIRRSGGPARVRADFGCLEQVVLNLAVNARDAMPGGGRLDMEIGVSVLGQPAVHRHGTVPPGRYVTLSVTDAGCGMSEETQSHLFEPFFTTKEQGKGTGLGLPTIYGIVTQSGGHISVYSEEGKGTCFRIYLPEAPAAAEPSKPAETRKPVLFRGAATILLVEDDPSIRALGRRVLAADGFTVVHAASGPEALELCEKRGAPVHLLLTDMVMPEMSGPELAGRLAGRWPGLKVMFMSGYTEHAALDDGLLREGAAFIQKPFAPDALLRAVRETLAGPEDR
ncbi:MAG: response regulator [Elusimicrobiota bacterium]